MQKSRILSDHKIKKILYELNNFFYKSQSINISIDIAVKHKNFSDFEKNMKQAMTEQIKKYNTEENISSILLTLNKADDKLYNLIAIGSILTFIDGAGMNSFFRWAAILGGTYALSMMNAENLEFYIGKDSERIIDSRIALFSTQIDNTTRKIVYNFIIDGYKKGMNALEIVEYIDINIDKFIDRRAGVIAETELVNMFSAFAHETYVRNGATKHKWVTAKDEGVCPICTANAAVGYIGIGDTFPSGALYPPAHVGGCRCFTIPDTSVNGRVWRG